MGPRNSLALCLGLLCLAMPARAQASDPKSEDWLYLAFPREREQQLTMLDFAGLVEEGAGLHLTYADDMRSLLASERIVVPPLRVPKSRFAEFARLQFLLHGFGWFPEEAKPAEMAVRPVPFSLLRVLLSPSETADWSDGRDHLRPFLPTALGESERSRVEHDATRTVPGYTLITAAASAEAALLDPRDHEVRRWTDPEGGVGWDLALPLRNGDLLCVDSRKECLLRLGVDGRTVWRLALAVHHDALELEDGRILVLSRRSRAPAPTEPRIPRVDSLVTVVSGDGRVLAEHSLLDLLQGSAGVRLEPRVDPRNVPPGYELDPLHASSLDCLDRRTGTNPPFRPGCVLVTLRNPDALALLDLEEKRCVWTWGPGVLHAPHDAVVLPGGNLLVLDDGDEPRSGARVIEVEPATKRILWQYRPATPDTLPAVGRGMLQPLEGGNVLIGSSGQDEAFEVTRAGEVPWRLVDVHDGGHGIRHVRRLDPATAATLLGTPR